MDEVCKNVVSELFTFTQESKSHGYEQSSSGNVQSNMAQECGIESGAVCLTSKWNHNKYCILSFFNILHTHIHAEINMPPILRKRGRPKGHEVTVIGLPAKKVKKGVSGDQSTDRRRKPLPLIKLHTSLKEGMR